MDDEQRMELVRADTMRLIHADEVPVDPDELASAAMRVPADERAEPADRQIASLTGSRGHDRAWEAEMNRRIGEIQAGTAETLSEEEFLEKLETRRAARQMP